MTRELLESTHLHHLYIPSNVEHIERDSLAGIDHVELSPNNKRFTTSSEEFIRGRGLSPLGTLTDSGQFIFRSDIRQIPEEEFSGSSLVKTLDFESCKFLSSVGAYAFARSNLQGITLPSTVTELQEGCFSECQQLHYVEIAAESKLPEFPIKMLSGSSVAYLCVPASVKVIGESCFEKSPLTAIEFAAAGCLVRIEDKAFQSTKLCNLSVPGSVVHIGNCSFASNTSLETVVFERGSHLTHIGRRCFAGCSIHTIRLPRSLEHVGSEALQGIENVTLDSSNCHFVVDGKFLYSMDHTILYGGALSVRDLDLPRCIFVGEMSFRESRFQSVTVAPEIKSLENSCFCGSSKLKSITFRGKSQLELIGSSAFEDTGLCSVTFPSSVRCIREKAFSNCKQLSIVSFEEPCCIKMFSKGLFNNTRIYVISIPDCVTTIDAECFSGCTSLASIVFGGNSRLKRICSSAFENCAVAKLELPSKLVALGPRAFARCDQLKLLDFGADPSILFIGSEAFAECSSLKSVILPDCMYQISGDAFANDCELQMETSDSSIAERFGDWNNARPSDHYTHPEYDDRILVRACLLTQKTIGKGGQAFVKLKQNIISGDPVAVKTMDFLRMNIDDEAVEKLQSHELAIQDFSDPCLVSMKGMSFDEARRRLTVAMEFVTVGQCNTLNLKQVLENQPAWWTPGRQYITMIGVAHGLAYIHGNGFIHCDMKPSNILFDSHYHPKICDFDSTRSQDDPSSLAQGLGTFGYVAPEATTEFKEKSDLYSFGVILYEIHEGPAAMKKSLSASGFLSPSFTERTPTRMRKCIESCVGQNPDYRCDYLDEQDTTLESELISIARDVLRDQPDELQLVEAFVTDLGLE